MSKDAGRLAAGFGCIIGAIVLITGFAVPAWAVAIYLLVTGVLLVLGR